MHDRRWEDALSKVDTGTLTRSAKIPNKSDLYFLTHVRSHLESNEDNDGRRWEDALSKVETRTISN